MSYKIHNEKNYSDNTSLRDVNDDVTELLTSGNRKVDYAIQSNIVALKVIEGSKNMPSNFLNELKSHQSCLDCGGFLKRYVVSKEPSTKDYILVMEFMSKMDLQREFISKIKVLRP
ncbi:hypothetical protein C2G38_2174078 [Gigaspora rosea]|uniref:Protein kinase domain-containing protein n=1 Tax=Gigaspora rosea TaxID=44941 RepID=A0A397VM32_9GLOM|nr:hypothetical protein C2G38_2174077 [Gigaspora rosea]RIB22387.1 hypothetical protein C2G38_2174078 [Gigaspora rosea]